MSATAPKRLGRTIAPTMTRADKTHVSLLKLMFALVLLACVVAARKTVVGEREPLH